MSRSKNTARGKRKLRTLNRRKKLAVKLHAREIGRHVWTHPEDPLW